MFPLLGVLGVPTGPSTLLMKHVTESPLLVQVAPADGNERVYETWSFFQTLACTFGCAWHSVRTHTLTLTFLLGHSSRLMNGASLQ